MRRVPNRRGDRLLLSLTVAFLDRRTSVFGFLVEHVLGAFGFLSCLYLDLHVTRSNRLLRDWAGAGLRAGEVGVGSGS